MKTLHEVHRAPRSVYRTSPAPARGPQFWGACPPFDAAGAVGGVQLSGPQWIVAAIRRRSGALLIAEMLDPVELAPMVRVPFVRGLVNLLRGFRRSSLQHFSSELYREDLQAKDAGEANAPEEVQLMQLEPAPKLSWGATLKGAFGRVLLAILPGHLGAALLDRVFGWGLPIASPAFQALSMACTLLVIVAYFRLIMRMSDVRDVFGGNTAGAMLLMACEQGQTLSIDSVRRQPSVSPWMARMFTTWAAATAVFVGASVPLQSLVLDGRVLPHVVVLCMKLLAAFPVISIAYEINDFLLRHCRTGPLKVLAWPGLLFARLFSVEPDDGQIEVAIAAMVRLRELEGDEALGLAPRV